MINQTLVYFILFWSSLAAAVDVGSEGGGFDPLELSTAKYSQSINTQYRNNTGQLLLDVAIPLPHELNYEFNAVELRYSTGLLRNLGMGVGFEWGLPQIIYDAKNPRSSFLFSNGKSIHELIRYQEASDIIEYRERNLSLFVKVIRQTDRTWRVLHPDGTIWLFNDQGLPTNRTDQFKNTTKFVWEENQLIQILNSGWNSAQLKYGQCASSATDVRLLLPFFHNGRRYSVGKCLNKIEFNTGKAITFSYSDQGNLLKIKWSESGDQVFQASYALANERRNVQCQNWGLMQPTVGQFWMSTDILNGRFTTVQSLLYSLRLETQLRTGTCSGIMCRTPKYESDSRISFALPIDMNNDRNIKFLYVSYIYRVGTGWLKPTWSLLKFNQNSLLSSDSISIPGLQTLSPYKQAQPGEIESKKNYKPFIGDLNGDGFSDIAVCSEGSLYKFMNDKKESLLPPVNMTDVSGVNISCSEKMIARDLNLDGLTDFISDDGSIYFSQVDGSILKYNQQQPNQVKKWVNSYLQVNNEKQAQFADFDGDGFPEQIDHLITSSDINHDLQPEFWFSNGECKLPTRSTQIAQISEITEVDGGKSRYVFDESFTGPILRQISKDPLVGPVATEVLSFSDLVIDHASQLVMGYKNVRKDSLPYQYQQAIYEGSTQIDTYGIDKLSIKNREPLLGYLLTSLTCKYQTCSLEDNQWLKFEVNSYMRIESSNLKGYTGPNSLQGYVFRDNTKVSLLNNAKAVESFLSTIFSPTSFSDLGVMESWEQTFGDGMQVEIGASQAKVNEKTYRKYINKDQELLPVRMIKYGHDFMNPILDVAYTYQGNKGNSPFTVTQFAGKSQQGSYVVYNEKGLVTKSVSVLGAVQSVSYSGNEKTVLSTGDLTVTKVDEFGKVISYLKSADDKIISARFSRKDSGRITKFLKNDQQINVSEAKVGNMTLLKISDTANLYNQYEAYDGFGKRIYSGSQFGDSYLLRGIRITDGFGVVVAESDQFVTKQLGEFKFPNMRWNSRDALSRVVSVISPTVQIEWQRNGNCSSKKISGMNAVVERVCLDSVGNPIEVTRGVDNLNVFLSNPESNPVYSGGWKYEYNDSNELVTASLGNQSYKIKRSNDRRNIVDAFSTQKLDENGFILEAKFPNQTKEIRTYDGFNNVVSIQQSNGVAVNFSYDQLNRNNGAGITDKDQQSSISYRSNEFNGHLENVQIKSNFGKNNLDFVWNNYQLSAIQPFIESMEYDPTGSVNKMNFKNLTVSFSRDIDGKLQSIDAISRQDKWNYKLVWRKNAIIERTKTSYQGQLIKQDFTYDEGRQLIKSDHSTGSANVHEESPFLLSALDLPNDISVKGAVVDRFQDYEIQYGAKNQIVGIRLMSDPGKDLKFPLPDFHMIKGHTVVYFRHTGTFIGALIQGPKVNGFFPILTDQLNSIRAIFNSDGKLIITRNYKSWGAELSTHVESGAEEINELIRYSFAGLVQPLGSKYLLSQSRVYWPQGGRWVTADPLAILNPKQLYKNSIFEADGFSYAKNNPVLLVDPTGHIATLAPAVVSFGVVYAINFGFEYYSSRDLAHAAINSALPAAISAVTVATAGAVTSAVAPKLIAQSGWPLSEATTHFVVNATVTTSMTGATEYGRYKFFNPKGEDYNVLPVILSPIGATPGSAALKYVAVMNATKEGVEHGLLVSGIESLLDALGDKLWENVYNPASLQMKSDFMSADQIQNTIENNRSIKPVIHQNRQQ